MTLQLVKESYIKYRLQLWDKMHNTSDPDEYKQLAEQYNDCCECYDEFLVANNLSDEQ